MEPSLELPQHPTSGVTHFDALEQKRQRLTSDVSIRAEVHVDKRILLETAKAVRSNCALTVFGFDVIVDAVSGQHLLIDVNHFPSMKRIPRSVEALHEALFNAIQDFKASQSECDALHLSTNKGV